MLWMMKKQTKDLIPKHVIRRLYKPTYFGCQTDYTGRGYPITTIVSVGPKHLIDNIDKKYLLLQHPYQSNRQDSVYPLFCTVDGPGEIIQEIDFVAENSELFDDTSAHQGSSSSKS